MKKLPILISVLSVFLMSPANVTFASDRFSDLISSDDDNDTSEYIFKIKITVIDAKTSAPVKNADVALLGIELEKTSLKMKTDDAGQCYMVDVPRYYHISVKSKGYRQKIVEIDQKISELLIKINPKE